jgi:murein DD-endopeptidase MepM/ murein hydrolase activator NlpD
MNIILVSEKLAKAKTITLGAPHLIMFGVGAFLIVVSLAGLLHYVTLRLAAESNLPYLQSFPVSPRAGPLEKFEAHDRENLNALAVRLGQMQAQLLRLDTLGERLARLAGFKPQELMFDQIPGRGGATSSIPSQDLTLGDFTRQIELLTRQLDDRTDRLGILESLFTLDRAKKKLVPTMMPVSGGWYSSNYGWRIDPFTGRRAFHEGIDFIAGHGTPIRAAAGGVVVYSGYHPQYGKMVEVEHGDEILTRYAHASKLLVRVGDVVMRGTKIAEVGRTGRATGTHLHFEVRERGAPQNPVQFLRLPG